MKRIACFLLALAVILSLAIPAFAADNDGKITIQGTAEVPVKGKTFKVYKILDLTLDSTNQHYSYTVPEALKSFYESYVWPAETEIVDGAETVTRPAGAYNAESADADVTFDRFVYARLAAMSANSHELNQFAIAALAAAAEAAKTNEGILVKSKKAEETTLTFDGLPLGYYLIEDANAATKEVPVSALILDSTGREMTVTLKADVPTLDKSIDGDSDTDGDSKGKVDGNIAAIGDAIPFVLTTAVPNMTGYNLYGEYYFIINDTLTKGLTYDAAKAAMVVTVGNDTLTADTDYTVDVTKETDNTAVEITFIDFYEKYNARQGEKIVVTYNAILNENAVIGAEGNPNVATLSYSNDPSVDTHWHPDNPDNPDPDPDDDDPQPEGWEPPIGVTPETVTRTYVTELNLVKVDADGKALTGAEFTVTGDTMNTVLVKTTVYTEAADGTYYKLKDGTYTTEAPTGVTEHDDLYENTATKYAPSTVVTTETKGTEGYMANVAVDPDGKLTLTGLQAGTYKIVETKSPNGYNLLNSPIYITISCEMFDTFRETEGGCTWTYSLDVDSDENASLVANTSNTFQIVNQAGMELPSTGGMGTTLFYALGGTMMLMAVVLLVTRKRVSM